MLVVVYAVKNLLLSVGKGNRIQANCKAYCSDRLTDLLNSQALLTTWQEETSHLKDIVK